MDKGFSYIPACMLKLPPELYHLWGAIRSTMKGGPEVPIQTLCELTGKGERQVFRNLALLAKCGAICIESKPGQRRKIFCTPENFQWKKLEDSIDNKKKVEDRKAEVPPQPNTVAQDTVMEGAVTYDRGGVSSMTKEPVTHDSRNERKENKNIYNTTPLSPQERKNAKQTVSESHPASSQKSSPLLDSSLLDSYKVLDAFRKAAGAKLALGELIASPSPPPGFAGVLPPPLEQKWYDFLQEYTFPLKLSQDELEKRFARVGSYMAFGKNYWVKDGKMIALRWFCNPVHRNRVYELMDEAITWDQEQAQTLSVKPSSQSNESAPAEKRTDWKAAWNACEPIPESAKEILSRILGRPFGANPQNSVEIQAVDG